jgi:hypothetical protein
MVGGEEETRAADISNQGSTGVVVQGRPGWLRYRCGVTAFLASGGPKRTRPLIPRLDLEMYKSKSSLRGNCESFSN